MDQIGITQITFGEGTIITPELSYLDSLELAKSISKHLGISFTYTLIA